MKLSVFVGISLEISSLLYAFPQLSTEIENDLKKNAKLAPEYIAKYAEFLKSNRENVAKNLPEKDQNSEDKDHELNPSSKIKVGEYGDLFEGDLLLTDRQMSRLTHILMNGPSKDSPAKNDTNTKQFAALSADLSGQWTMPVRFYFDPSFNGRKATVRSALQHWQDNTCVTFQEMNAAPAGGDDNYIRVIAGNGCYSNVGSVSPGQTLSLGQGCVYKGIAAHEFGHALGLWHEQSRPDRDYYVTINTKNIYRQTLSNFQKYSTSDVALTDQIPYDLGSIMHYGSTAFAINEDTPSIVANNPLFQNTMGQRDALSFYDIKAVNTRYCECDTSLQCYHDGYPDPKDCNKCRCPEGFGGDLCDQALYINDGCGEINLAAGSDWQTLEISGVGTCYYYITSPEKTKVQLDFTGSAFACALTCSPNPGYGYVEARYQGYLSNTGPRLCCDTPENIVSEENEALVLYRGQASSSLFVRYKSTSSDDEQADFGMDGVWFKWSEWSPCTASCGSCGVHSRTRKCSKKNACRGSSKLTTLCNRRPCPNTEQPCCKPHALLPGGQECGRRKVTTQQSTTMETKVTTTVVEPKA
uniref:Zinc metalloproteinase n=1 Tax=Romanomermis culicivorax TaxID=13658 RepID=A0A915HNG2_ROMCU